MQITKVKIKKVTPNEGLVGFASCVIDDCLYVGNIAIFTRLGEKTRLRLVFPIKEVGEIKIPVLYPLTAQLYYALEQAVADKYYEND